MRLPCRFVVLLILLPVVVSGRPDRLLAADIPAKWTKLGEGPGDRMLAAYFQSEAAQLRDACLDDVETLDQWKAKRESYRKDLLEMLGLDPLPERTDLKATVTGTQDHELFTVEKLHYQSRPGLYVTGNLYVPKGLKEPVPAILYVCGHGRVKKDGISYGNKVHYQHHPGWFARHGYVCLVIDSVQLGEIEGIHHGTYDHDMWWWNNRGYTPAGVEAWNCVRALDYLQSRKEVDPERIGVTGRSGGGVYSWWIAAIDQRIKAAVPVAGITDVQNHVVDGCVEGHCDCMFFVNTYGWDYPLVVALVAPRPLLIGNSDNDSIFPIDGVKRTYEKARKIYKLYGAEENVALLVTSGGHNDTPELRMPAFRWFDKHLKGEERPVDKPAEKFFQPEQLKVFPEEDLPGDQLNTEIHETFVTAAGAPAAPSSWEEWQKQRDGWRKALEVKVFRGWPDAPGSLDIKKIFSVERHDVRLSAYDFTSQEHIRLRIYLTERAGSDKAELAVLNVLDQQSWNTLLATIRPGFEAELKGETLPEADSEAFEKLRQVHKSQKWLIAHVAPRGIGSTAWNQDKRKQTQIRRRFMLLGQTLDGMRVWDVRRAMQALRSLESGKDLPVNLQSQRRMAGAVLYASLFEPEVQSLTLVDVPPTHRDGPILLSVRRYLDVPQAVAMAAERSPVLIYSAAAEAWQYPASVAKQLGWGEKRLQVDKLPLEQRE